MTASNPSVAFLIVAHEKPAQLARLARRLEAPWSDILIMINKKVDERPFEEALAGIQVRFVPNDERILIEWGSIGFVHAILKLMQCALETTSAQRLCLLSGADYPIKDIEAIRHTLSSDRQFLRIDRELRPNGETHWDGFVRFRHYNHLRILNSRSSPWPSLQRSFRKVSRRFPRRPLPNVRFYHGSGWWALTRDAAMYVYKTIEWNPELLRWMRAVYCPDEILFHTVLKNSPFSDQISHDFSETQAGLSADNRCVYGCHYIDWSVPNSSSPKVLRLEDLTNLRESPALFARKVDPVISSDLLDELDQLDFKPQASPAKSPIPREGV